MCAKSIGVGPSLAPLCAVGTCIGACVTVTDDGVVRYLVAALDWASLLLSAGATKFRGFGLKFRR